MVGIAYLLNFLHRTMMQKFVFMALSLVEDPSVSLLLISQTHTTAEHKSCKRNVYPSRTGEIMAPGSPRPKGRLFLSKVSAARTQVRVSRITE